MIPGPESVLARCRSEAAKANSALARRQGGGGQIAGRARGLDRRLALGAGANVEKIRRGRQEIGDHGFSADHRVARMLLDPKQAPGHRRGDLVDLAHPRAPLVGDFDRKGPRVTDATSTGTACGQKLHASSAAATRPRDSQTSARRVV